MRKNTTEDSSLANSAAADSGVPLEWLRFLAGAVGTIAALGLIFLMAQGANAAPKERKPAQSAGGGFQPGEKSFSNPFAPSQNPSEDQEEADAAPPAPRADRPARTERSSAPPNQTSTNQGSVSIGGEPKSPGPDVTITDKGIDIGGKQDVISHSDLGGLSVDTFSGRGSNEVVTDFNFPDADIVDIANALGKLTGKNFILDKDVKGRITIVSNSPITVSDAWRAFLTALDINGYALIESGKFIRIARQRDARDKQIKAYIGEYSPDTDALITKVFPLKFLGADEVARTFRSFMPANSRIIPYDQTNTVIVTDTGSNVQKLERLLVILDVETHEAGIEVIPVKHAAAAELAKLIDTLIPESGAAAPARRGRPARRSSRGGSFSARRTQEGGFINNIIADDRTNSLIVHASRKGIDQVKDLIKRLDRKVPAVQGGGKIHVVYLQFADAEEIATTLNNLSSQAGAPAPRGRTGTTGTGANPIQANLFEGTIRVSPDKSTNSLVITASPSDFSTMRRVINMLDIPRDQVYAQVVIMEISLGKDFQLSSDIISPTNANIASIQSGTDLAALIINPFSQKGLTLPLGAGNETSITLPNGQSHRIKSITSLIRLLQTQSNANVLATPQILALDNTEATFETAERIPVPTQTVTQTSTQTTVTGQDISLKITIKPQINKVTNFVKLDIETKLADISQRELPAQVRDIAFATIDRTAKTSVVVANKDTVVLGGLMRDNRSETVSKVPVLGDIPLLGWLFKSRRSQTTKTNLLVFITPEIIRQYETIRGILDKKLKERDDFIEKTTGGDDPLRAYRDKLIRSLPDISSLNQPNPNAFVTVDKERESTEIDRGDTLSAPDDEPMDEHSGEGEEFFPPDMGEAPVEDYEPPVSDFSEAPPATAPDDFPAPGNGDVGSYD